VHETIAVLSFLRLVATRWFGSFAVYLVTSVLTALLDLMFVAMQRYNRPLVVRLAERESGKSRQGGIQ
jgi:hypothetical protein